MENHTARTAEAQGPGTILEDIIRRGARQMLAVALEAEVDEFLARHAERRDQHGHRLAVRNGHLPERAFRHRHRTDSDPAAAGR